MNAHLECIALPWSSSVENYIPLLVGISISFLFDYFLLSVFFWAVEEEEEGLPSSSAGGGEECCYTTILPKSK